MNCTESNASTPTKKKLAAGMMSERSVDTVAGAKRSKRLSRALSQAIGVVVVPEEPEFTIEEKPGWQLTPHAIKHTVKHCNASEEQREFLEFFEELIVEPRLAAERRAHEAQKKLSEASTDHRLVVSSDMRTLELLIALDGLQQLSEVTSDLLNSMELPSADVDAALERIRNVDTVAQQSSTTGHKVHPTGVGIYLRLEGMGTGRPSADVGFRIEYHKGEFRGALEWSGVDVLLPPSEAKDQLLDFAMVQLPPRPVTAICGSLLPAEPELGMEIVQPAGGSMVCSGLLYLRALHLEMPDEEALAALHASRPWDVVVKVVFGLGGVRRAAVQLHHPEAQEGEWLAACLGHVDYRRKEIRALARRLEAEQPRHLELSIDAEGYGVGVGFCR